MNLRKLRRERAAGKASTAVVDGTVKALPAGDEPRAIPVEPLSEPASGREEARAAFVRDTGGAAPPPESSSQGSSQGPSSSSSSSPPNSSGDADGAAPEVTVDGVVTMAVGALDAAATLLGPRFIGGDGALWAQSEKETKGLSAAAKPLATKWMAETNITPEALFLGTLAFMYVPRAFAGAMERAARKKQRAHGAAHDVVDARPVVPPAPPAAPAPPAPPAPQAPQAPPAAAPPTAPQAPSPGETESPAAFLRSVRGG